MNERPHRHLAGAWLGRFEKLIVNRVGTKQRLGETQICPQLANFRSITISAAFSIAASGETSIGALPPISTEKCFTLVQNAFITSRPPRVDLIIFTIAGTSLCRNGLIAS